jgi:hypothetical protein
MTMLAAQIGVRRTEEKSLQHDAKTAVPTMQTLFGHHTDTNTGRLGAGCFVPNARLKQPADCICKATRDREQDDSYPQLRTASATQTLLRSDAAVRASWLLRPGERSAAR